MDWASIQITIHSLVKALTGVDTQGIVTEKGEDVGEIRRLFALGLEAMEVLEAAFNDGIIDEFEWKAFKAKVDILDDQYKAVVEELKDWQAEE
jgi:hypothetical protein